MSANLCIQFQKGKHLQRSTHTVVAPSSEKAAKRKCAFHVCLRCWSSQQVLCKWKYLAVRDPPATPERVSTSRPRFCCITEVSSKLCRRCLRINGSRGSTAFVRLHLRCQKTKAAQSWRRSMVISSWCGCCGGWSTSTFLQHVSLAACSSAACSGSSKTGSSDGSRRHVAAAGRGLKYFTSTNNS